MLFAPSGPLEFITYDILEALPPREKGNQHVVIISGRHLKLTQVMHKANNSGTYVSTILFYNWFSSYSIPESVLSGIGPQFVAKLFEKLCTDLKVKHLVTNAYHLQTNGQMERYNKTLMDRFRQHVADQ